MWEMVVVFAHWCPKCNMMLPIVDDIEKDYIACMKVVRIDAEEHPEVMELYEIELVPTFIIKHDEKEVVRMAGLIGEETLRERIENTLKEE